MGLLRRPYIIVALFFLFLAVLAIGITRSFFLLPQDKMYAAIESGDLAAAQNLARSFPDVVNSVDLESGDAMLHAAVIKGREDFAKWLLQNGADVDKRDIFGRTALHRAVEMGNLNMVELLVKYGASVNAKNETGGTPLKDALDNKRDAMAELLRRHGAKLE